MALPTTCSLEPFVSQVTSTEPPTGHAVTLIQQEIEAYLKRLKDAICTDLTALEARVTAIEAVLVDCCGTNLGA
jgi:hypothetical protein